MIRQTVQVANSDWAGILYALLAIIAGVGIASSVYLAPDPVLLVVAVGGLAIVLILLMKIQWGLYLLTFSIYLNLSFVTTNYYGAPSFMKLLIPTIFALAMLHLYTQRIIPEGLYRIAIPVGLYLLVSFAGLWYAEDFGRTLESLEIYVKDILIAITVILILKRGNTYRNVMRAFIIAGGFLGIISVYQYLTGTFGDSYWGFGQATYAHIIGQTHDYRIGGPVGSPTEFGHIIAIVIPLAFERLVNERILPFRIIAGTTLFVSILALVFTFSRSAFLGLIVMSAVLMILNPPKPGGLVALVLVGIVVIQFLPATYMDRIATLTEFLPGSAEANNEVSFRGRSSEGTVAWRMFLDNAVVGVGLDNYSLYYQDYSRQLGIDSRRVDRTAHNRYLEVLAEQGVIGFAAFVFLLGSMLRSVLIAKDRFQQANDREGVYLATALFVSIIGYFTVYFFIDDTHPRYFWLLVGLAFALPQVATFETNRLKHKRYQLNRSLRVLKAKVS